MLRPPWVQKEELEEKFIKLFHSLPVNGWLRENEARLLYEVAFWCDKAILEVGSYYGRSTVLLSSLGRKVISVDPFDHFDSDDPSGEMVQRKFWENINSRGIENVHQCPMKIEQWHNVHGPIGFAYLDGDHTYQGTINQIAAAIKHGAEEVCIHDYADSGGGVEIKRAIEDSKLLKLERVVETMAHCYIDL